MSTVAGDDRPSVSEAAAGFDVVTREVEALAVEPPAPLRLAAPVPPGDPRLARAFAASGAATLIVLAAINGTDYAVSAALAVLAPDVERTLHLSDTGFLTTVSLTGLFFALAALPVGIVSDRVSRPKVTGYLTVIAGLATLATAGVRTGAQLGFARVATGAAQSGIQVTHLPLLADTYPVAARQRVYAIHSLMPNVAVVIGPLVAGPMAALIGGSAGWRWPFVLLAGISVTLGLLAIRLAEPGRGASERDDGDQPLVLERASLGPSLARLLRIRSLTGLLTALTVLGGVLIAVPSLLSLYLERVHHLGASGRGLVSAIVGLGAMAGLLAGARVGERLLSEHPQRVARLVALALCVYAVLLSGALRLHSLTAVTVGATVASFFGQLGIVPLYVIITGIVPPRLRSLSFALVGLAVVVGGGLIGSVAGGALSDDHGTVFALTAVLLGSTPIAAAVIFRSSAFLAEDLRAALEPPVVDEPRELLSLRRVSVSLGSQRVLHEIDLDVRRGEVVALLGTNGAGKSTLLSAISGLIPLDSGSISLDGGELAQATTAARVAAGLVQMPGGRALFPELSVRENLLAGTHTYAWDAQRVSRETLRVLEIFPILSTRLRQPAGSLSGGEQQLLGLAKALLLSPRLLMIDELTLGLSPVAVDQVLTVVSRLRAEGVSMLIVEQSISLATRIADRAIFLERGRVRFDGPPSELLARGDLARAVFLGADGG